MTFESGAEGLVIPRREPTSMQSYFLREQNLRILADQVIRKEGIGKNWRILSVGCGYGAEPQELAMRLLDLGFTNFQIDAIDMSREAITEAQRGEIQIYNPSFSSEGKFLQEAARSSLLEHDGISVSADDPMWESSQKVKLSLSDKVRSRINFSAHDILTAPYGNPATYDVVICNNVLPHYSNWERDLILSHLLHSMKDGGFLALENNRNLTISLGPEPKREVWLKSYFAWKNNLARFGLEQEAYKFNYDNYFFKIFLFRYNAEKNKYRIDKPAVKAREMIDRTRLKLKTIAKRR